MQSSTAFGRITSLDQRRKHFDESIGIGRSKTYPALASGERRAASVGNIAEDISIIFPGIDS
jgi:hypothetical protein